jgi:excinuclease UvrABC ATPase subunit
VYGGLRPAGAFKKLEGAEYVDKVIDIDQSPIGRTPRSNPATYVGVFGGKRFNRETLEIRYKGRNIADVLDMAIEEAEAFFGYIPHIARKMETLLSVGLGYVKLGQSALTLSGGETPLSAFW